ncbi:hypothetical protein COCSADRAFT_253116 [Bipolaris sorokiniana ND90Pr]|uniref:Uncharacterized protein n=1 Tax=Cochliobolus sativus (strain ND90Pr / ATCC 201652) TaxID=665912 RepID=M2SRJ9_COCSN|nr:uncharacterized protein COCSADRAFT_253116 [Bipolaris sorokiniana ND90Pr]EMD59711.1 hypothetical protein COCSADRAFT_253116 [Bipolaris sorokiniana ND90Pr]
MWKSHSALAIGVFMNSKSCEQLSALPTAITTEKEKKRLKSYSLERQYAVIEIEADSTYVGATYNRQIQWYHVPGPSLSMVLGIVLPISNETTKPYIR